MSSDEALASGILTFSFDERRDKAVRYWQDLLGRGTQISLPEPKVNAAWQASLAYHFMARDRHAGQAHEGRAVQRVDHFGHEQFSLLHAAHVVRMYDLLDYHHLAAEVLRYFLARQKPDGSFSSGEGQWGDFGPALWALCQHFELNRDVVYAREIYPAVKKAVRWLQETRRNDPWHLFPAALPGGANDNAGRRFHFTGDNFYALLGLRHAIQLARAVGAPEDVSLFTREYEQMHAAFIRKLDEVTKTTGGYIPPALESMDGFDGRTPAGGNLVSVYPTEVLAPTDEKVAATLAKARGQFQEGLLAQSHDQWPVQPWMHQDLTADVAATELLRGEQERVIERLYAMLIHTSATHAGLYYPMRPWGDRASCKWQVASGKSVDLQTCKLANLQTFAASFVMLVRNMLLREEERDLHLFSAVAPAWMKVGQKISVRNAVTQFGKVTFVAEVMADRLVIDVSSSWRTVPRYFVFHFPYFTEIKRILVDGREISLQSDRANLSPHARRVEIFWQNEAPRQRLSYATAVADFKREYRERYRLWQARLGQAGQSPAAAAPSTTPAHSTKQP
jgi:hypothetical protein